MAEDDKTESENSEPSLIAKLKSDKKLMIMVGGGALLLLLIIGGVTYYFLSGDETKSDVVTEEGVDLETEGALGEGEDAASGLVQSKFEKVHMYPLKSFFFPIKLKGKEESGHFLLVTPNFSMSNPGLGGQISKNLPNIRKRIYNILLRQSYKNLTTKIKSTKERVKKRIIAKVNELLPVGTGVIQEVYFSEFVVK
ncbi:flagellar basal body-associated FliL family protein [Nitrospinaceae bacterium]|nr:flagellar basal body-associated FliL family protein [Nitrospinaceae bacterium]